MIERVTDIIVDRPVAVVGVFLLATVFLSFGITQISVSGGAGDFTEGTEEIEALEDIQAAFGDDSQSNTTQTTLLLRDDNAISKENQLLLLQELEAVSETSNQSVRETRSFPQLVAQQIDPTATTIEEQQQVLRNASSTQVSEATQGLLGTPAGDEYVAKQADKEDVTAPAMRAFVVHNTSAEASRGPGTNEELVDLQRGTQDIVSSEKITLYGEGIAGFESDQLTTDSLILVLPLAFILISLFIGVSYRTGRDIAIGIGTLLLSVVWTFGLLGWLGISLNPVVTIVPVILLAVGVDFGIHVINRYREEDGDPEEAMRAASRQLVVAFLLVTVTTVVGFGSNVTSPLSPLRAYGIAAAIGILSTFLLFGIFLPALKLVVGERSGTRSASIGDLPVFRTVLTRIVDIIARFSLGIIVVALILTAMFAAFGTGVQSEFEQSSFQPPADRPAYTEPLPEPVRPYDYETTATRNYIEEHFKGENRTAVIIAVNGNLTHPDTLEQFAAAEQQTPAVLMLEGESTKTGPLTIINQTAAQNQSYAEAVDQADTDGNGVPDENLSTVYDPITGTDGQLSQFVSDDRSTAQVIYTADINESQSTITQDSQQLASEYESDELDATATGLPLVLKSVSDLITESIVVSLAVGLSISVLFLTAGYWLLDRRPVLGLANILPVLFGIAAIAATMRLLGINFNAVTSLILSTAVGLGLDYSVHVTHRFTDEFDGANTMEAVQRSVIGTGGALTGTMLTTLGGLGTLTFSLFPVLAQFGILIGLTVVYTYLATLLILPAALIVYGRRVSDDDEE